MPSLFTASNFPLSNFSPPEERQTKENLRRPAFHSRLQTEYVSLRS